MAESFYGEARTEGGGLPRGWKEVSIGEIADIVGGGTPSSKVEKYWHGTIPWLTPKDLSGYAYRRIGGGKRNISPLGLKESSAQLLPKDTVLVTSRAPIGYVALADGEVTTNQGFKNLILNTGYDPEFFYYLIKHNVPKMKALQTGSTFGEISGNSMKQIRLKVPPISEQRRIAEVLGSLDDKIELNRRMSQTLEAISQATFKSWFVDFDPVIDNALVAGNEIPMALQSRASRRVSGDRSLPPAIQRLFPSEFESSAQGPIPKGWKIKRADDVADIYIGKTPPRKEPQWFSRVHHESEVWVSIRDMASCGVFIGDSSEYLSHEAVRKFNVRMAPKNSVLVSFKLTVGRVAITQTELATNEAIAHFVSPKYGLSSEYLYCYLSAYQYASLASTSSIATAINSKIVKSIPFLVPPGSLARAFHEQVFPYFTKISGLTCQTQSLSGLRDVLLPRLLSGTVSLHESGV